MRSIVLAFATGLGTGFMPIAPLFWAMSFQPWWLYLVSLVGLVALASFAADVASAHWKQSDCQKIVIDEVAGYLTTMFLAPARWQYALAGFVFFRLFDILKPWPSSYFDRKVHNGFGVVMDDVAAGVYACGATHLTAYLFALAEAPWV
jgi:phosphatidylglycerophosphatase A